MKINSKLKVSMVHFKVIQVAHQFYSYHKMNIIMWLYLRKYLKMAHCVN